MGTSLDEKNKPVVHVADVVHHGEKLVLPEKMEIDDAIDLLKRRKAFLTETVSHTANFKVFPYDGAHALAIVLRRKFGWAPGVPIRSFFGDKPPEVIDVEIGVGRSIGVPWGKFELPGSTIVLLTGGTFVGTGVQFQINGQCRRRDEEALRALFEEVRLECESNSLYRGGAFALQFRDDDGDALGIPRITFLDTDIDPSTVVYADAVQDQLDSAIFTPIQRIDELEANGMTFKSGILLGGVFGTGKTLAAKLASHYAHQAGVTFIYVRRADEIVSAIEFARLYEKSAAVVFCEDIDRVTRDSRDATIDNILNTIDGIDSKRTRVMVIATTNDLEAINPAMLRPGRMDAVINVTPPDAKAVERLIRVYGGSAVRAEEDLSEAGLALQGQIPAVIGEVLKRAKKAQMKLLPVGVRVTNITGRAIAEAAEGIRAQVALLTPKVEEPLGLEGALLDLVDRAVGKIKPTTGETLRRVKRVEERILD